jgi:hypothetical protein
VSPIIRRVSVPVIGGVVLFMVNNFLLAPVVTRLPGGTTVSATNMIAVALVVLSTRRFGAITLIYATYGLLGFLGHLGVDARVHLARLPLLLTAALVFDSIAALGRYRWQALAIGMLAFVLSVFFLVRSSHRPLTVVAALALAYAGLAAGGLVHRLAQGRSPGRRTR